MKSVGVSDAEIERLLQPKLTIDRYPSVVYFLEKLKKYHQLPGPVVSLILHHSGHSSAYNGVVLTMKNEGLITVTRGRYNGLAVNVYEITRKGLTELARVKKKRK